MKEAKRNVCIASAVTRIRCKRTDLDTALQEAFKRNEIDPETVTPNEIIGLCGDIESTLNGVWPKQDKMMQLDLFI